MSDEGVAATTALSVEDQLEILNLYSRYNHTVDAVELDAWTDCFVEDGALDVPTAGVVYTGAAELTEFATRYMSRNGGLERHLTTNVELWPDGEGGAGGRAYLLMMLGGSRRASAPTLSMSGRYADSLRKTAGGWRFVRRILSYDTV